MRPVDILFPEAAEVKRELKCPCCGTQINPATDFRDPLSLREYQISGLCQECQDSVFGG